MENTIRQPSQQNCVSAELSNRSAATGSPQWPHAARPAEPRLAGARTRSARPPSAGTDSMAAMATRMAGGVHGLGGARERPALRDVERADREHDRRR